MRDITFEARLQSVGMNMSRGAWLHWLHGSMAAWRGMRHTRHQRRESVRARAGEVSGPSQQQQQQQQQRAGVVMKVRVGAEHYNIYNQLARHKV